MKLTEEQREIALRVAKDAFNTESHRAWSYEGGDANVLDFAARFLAALPKPEPVGEMVNTIGVTQLGTQFGTRFKHVEFKNFDSLSVGTKFYTEAPIALPASEQKPVAYLFEDGSAVSVADLEFSPEKSGQRVVPLYLAPQPDYKAQRDAERYRWLRDQFWCEQEATFRLGTIFESWPKLVITNRAVELYWDRGTK